MSVSSDDDQGYQDWGEADSPDIYTALRNKDSSKTPMIGNSQMGPTPDFNLNQ